MKFILDGTAKKVLQPSRYKILKLLQVTDKPLYVQQIAELTKIPERMVSHHVDVLEEEKLVSCRYEISKVEDAKRGIAVRLCQSTPRSVEVMRDIRESV